MKTRFGRRSVGAALLLFGLLAAYIPLFLHIESSTYAEKYELAPTVPPAIQKVALGYLHQLGAEIALIKTEVFIGGLPLKLDPDLYAQRVRDHYRVMHALHPYLKDIYYKLQAHLAWIGGEQAIFVNQLLEKGMESNPNLSMLPYYAGFNYFYYLNQPIKAAHLLQKCIEIRGYKGSLGQLALVLLGKGGDIYGGLIWLKQMQAQEIDPAMKSRYEADIAIFEQTWSLFLAIEAFNKRHGYYPQVLNELIPGFLIRLPDLQQSDFELSYSAPQLKLIRKKIRN